MGTRKEWYISLLLWFRSQNALNPHAGFGSTVADRRLADMRTLQFGTMRPANGGSVAEFALHIQCPWRIDGPGGIITGSRDLWEPAEATPDFNWDDFHYDKVENLQDRRVAKWLAQYGPVLAVSGVDADEYGGAEIRFGGGFVLRLFPDGSRGEDWRLFRPATDLPHFVITGSKVQEDDEMLEA